MTPFFSYPQEIKLETEASLKKILGEHISLNYEKFIIPTSIKKEVEASSKQKFYSDHIYLYKIHNDNQLKAVAFLDNVYGKSLPITFLVVIDLSGNIIGTDIIKYREPYGGAVQNENWEKQFSGKNSNSNLKVGEDIDAISGATISVNSVTKGIQKILLLYEKIKNLITSDTN
jgi:Na+-translocating ferredoxin:NAD+ oxidoreductase RnfG subunit